MRKETRAFIWHFFILLCSVIYLGASIVNYKNGCYEFNLLNSVLFVSCLIAGVSSVINIHKNIE